MKDKKNTAKKDKKNGAAPRDTNWYATKVADSYPAVYQAISKLAQAIEKVTPEDAWIVSGMIARATRPKLKEAKGKMKAFREAHKTQKIDDRLKKNDEQRKKLEELRAALPS